MRGSVQGPQASTVIRMSGCDSPVAGVTPAEIVDRQWRAYNARDIDAYCALFDPQAIISRLNDGKEIARGADAIRRFYSERFKNPELHCEIKMRTVLGRFVIDHEQVTGIVEGILEVVAIYEVREERIQSIRILWA